MAELVIIPALIMGVVLGLLEMFFVHADERGFGLAWFTHGLHALPVMFLFLLVSMNLHWAASLIGYNLQENFTIDLVLRIVIGVIAAFKIAGAAAIARGSLIGEKLPHALIMGGLVAAAPYLWIYIVAPLVPNLG